MHFLDNDYTVSVKGNFYEVSGMRDKTYLERASELCSELLYFSVDKPARQMTLATVERYKPTQAGCEEVWLHVNLTKYDPDS